MGGRAQPSLGVLLALRSPLTRWTSFEEPAGVIKVAPLHGRGHPTSTFPFRGAHRTQLSENVGVQEEFWAMPSQ